MGKIKPQNSKALSFSVSFFYIETECTLVKHNIIHATLKSLVVSLIHVPGPCCLKGSKLEVQPFLYVHLDYIFFIQETVIKISEDTGQCFFADLPSFVSLVMASGKQKHSEVARFCQVQKLFG